MRYLICAIAALFGLFHLAAAAVQWRSQPEARQRAIIMLCGSVATLAASIAKLAAGGLGSISALVGGLLLVCVAAYLNGKAAGKVHPSHHAVRITIAVLLVAGFILF